MCSLRRRIFRLCFWMIALRPSRRSECLFALMLLFGDMTADFLAML